MSAQRKFPRGFFWGAATSAHQVEGNNHNDWSQWEKANAERLAKVAPAFYKTRVPNWSSFEDQARDPDNYISGAAADHYNRYSEDIKIMADLGLHAYRFSIEWSRIEPQEGKFNQDAIDHYRKVIRTLRDKGLEPFVTLHHFTNPIWLVQKDGWLNPSFPHYFARYAEFVGAQFSKDVKYWITINESESYLLGRYLRLRSAPTWPWPDWPDSERSLQKYSKAKKNMVKAHKAAYAAIKRISPQVQVGFSHAMVYFEPQNFLVKPLVAFLNRAGGAGFLNKVRHHQDFIGVNYYPRILVRIRGLNPVKFFITDPEAKDITDFGLEIYPPGIYKVTQSVKHYNVPIYITENGIADSQDHRRGDFISQHLRWLHRSIEDGADVRGYFYWSLLDNFEWSAGFWPQFGLVSVDRNTMQRLVRPSAKIYGQIAVANAIE